MGRQSKYKNGIYRQLQELMERMDSVEKEHKQEVKGFKEEISCLKKENKILCEENQLLRDDKARLKSIINNDSSNTSLPPSTDRKGRKPANTDHGRNKMERKSGGQMGHKGTTLTKAEIEQKIASGKCRHKIKTIDKDFGQKFITRYIIDLEVEPVITEVRHPCR